MSRFELSKFRPAPDPELICGICMNVLDSPYETPCRHVFCHDCISTAVKENQRCPNCRAPCREGKTKEVLPLVQNLINKLTMRCDNFDNGCTDLIMKEFFLDHVKSCGYVKVQCRYKSCGEELLRKDCEQHELSTCAYRDRVCEDGCGLMIPLEDASSHNCVEALKRMVESLKGLVEDLEEKNKQFVKRIEELLQQALEGIRKPASSDAAEGNQRDDDDSSFPSFTSSILSDSSLDTGSSSRSRDSDIATEAAFGELSDLLPSRATADRRRSRRSAVLPLGSEGDPSVWHLEGYDQSHSSDLPRNGNGSDHDNANRGLDNGEISDGNNSDGTSVFRMVRDFVNIMEGRQQLVNNDVEGNAASLDTSSQAGLEGAESSSVLDSPFSGASSKTSTEALSAGTSKRQLEEDSGFCGDSTARTRVKKIKQSSHSKERLSTQAEKTAFTSTSLTASNASDTSLLRRTTDCPNGNTELECQSAVNANSSLDLATCEVATTEPLSSNTEMLQHGHTSARSSESASSASSSRHIRNDSRVTHGSISHVGNDSNRHIRNDRVGNDRVTHSSISNVGNDRVTHNTNSNVGNDGNRVRRGPVTRSRGQVRQTQFEGNAISNVKVPPSCAYLLDLYARDGDYGDESWSPSDDDSV